MKNMQPDRIRVCLGCDVPEGSLHETYCEYDPCARCGEWCYQCQCKRPQRRTMAYVDFPHVCPRCGTLWPQLWGTSDRVWRHYIEPRRRHEIICYPCFKEIARLTDGGKYAAKFGKAHGWPAFIPWPPGEEPDDFKAMMAADDDAGEQGDGMTGDDRATT
jgi:hypothetical protein